MILMHFTKRIYECVLVHFYSKPSKALHKLSWDFAYYGLFLGIVVPFYLFHPLYEERLWPALTAPISAEGYIIYIYYSLFAFFLFC